MAQTGFTPIQLYYSSTTTNAPSAGNLASGELAINITDGKLFYKDDANAVQVIGWKTVPATAGGTGQTSYAVGDLLYANTTTTLAKLADVATGNALISGGVGVAPSWGKIGLTTHVNGTLPTANGGTNLTSFTANGVVYASSTSALATGSALVFDGTNLGVGVTPSAWSGLKGFQINTGLSFGGSSANGSISSNSFYDGSNWKYLTSSFATRYDANFSTNGSHVWLIAPSGTAGNAITFTEAMTLTAANDLLVGTTSTSVTNGGIYNRVTNAAGSSVIIGHQSGVATGNSFAEFQYAGSLIGYISQVGTTAVGYNSISDYRLKSNQLPLTNSGEFIDALQPKTWIWSKDGSKGVGFIAHEVQEISPLSVSGAKDAIDENGNPIYQAMEYGSSDFIANIIAELKSLRARLKAANIA